VNCKTWSGKPDPKKIDGGYRYDNGNYDYSSSGAMIGGELFASSSAERRDSTISRVYTTEEPARPAGGVHETDTAVISREVAYGHRGCGKGEFSISASVLGHK
jgi:hypothetical protein